MNPAIISLRVAFRFALKEVINKLQKIREYPSQSVEYDIYTHKMCSEDEELNYYNLKDFSLKLKQKSSGELELYIIFDQFSFGNKSKRKIVKVFTIDEFDDFQEFISDIEASSEILADIFYLIVSDSHKAMNEGFFIHPYDE